MSLDVVKVGFIPLVDAAIPIMAADVGFAAAEGLEIELTREVSWANIRDRLALGHFDAAHLLAPLAIATTLGLNSMKAELAAPMALGLNGNAMTFAPHLHDELLGFLPHDADIRDPTATATAFAALVKTRRGRGDEQPTLGMTFPFSTHNYQLRLWIAAGGLDPDRDVRLAVVPPPYMVDALQSGHVEGFCVGAPWNSLAVEMGIGRILHLGVDFVRRCPEKVLATRAGWLDERPETGGRLIRACAAAAAWIDEPANRPEVAERLAAKERLDVSAGVIRRTLEGRLPTGRGAEVLASEANMVFAQDGAMRPDPRHARWLFGEMARWGQVADVPQLRAAAERVYRPEVFEAVAGVAADAALAEDPLGLVIR